MKLLLRIYYFLSFVIFYILKLVQSNIIIAWEILTPKMDIKPGFITAPLKISTDFELLLLSNLVSMTPGSLSIHISEDKKQILIHVLYKNNEDNLLKEIDEFQKKIGRILNIE
ncbi:MAG: Na+/H+ antiporter subunit E [Bacteroidales bacterium]|nr:Na+/H+ antiporter subunit E [Bacteroidales bacterium]